MKILAKRTIKLVLSSGLMLCGQLSGSGQEPEPAPAAETVAEARGQPAVPDRYNIRLGSGGLTFSAGLGGVFVDNVYLTHDAPQEDFILIPEVDAGLFFPLGQRHTLAVNVGLAYYYYCRNHGLNASAPAVNPNSALELNLELGEFRLKATEAFSYQITPYYESGAQFFNVYNTGQFARYENLAGIAVQRDLHHLILDAGYHHHDLFADQSVYDYIDRTSELFDADAMFKVSPAVLLGLEGAGSLSSFPNRPVSDHWRASVGPSARLNLTEYITARLGLGYQRIEYDSGSAAGLGLDGFDSYYAFARIEHRINRFVSHSLNVSHENQIGINAANLEANPLVTYSLSWNATDAISVSPRVSYAHYLESYGPHGGALYREAFDYVTAGLSAAYALGQHWRFNLAYDYRLKNSDVTLYGYTQNLATIQATYRF